MNLRDLQYLVAVAEYKHFGKAAEACHVSQPTLSQQLKKLEEYLGAQLIERDSRRVQLTTLGADIAARARRVVSEADALVQLARSASDPLVGELRLGAFPTLAPYYLPQVLPLLRQKLPDLKLFLVEDKTPHLVQLVLRGELDAALLALPVPHEGLEAISLFHEPFMLAVPKQHALAKRKQVELEDLQGQSLLLLEDGHCLRDQALEVCHLAGAGENATFRASSLETLRQMVAGGIGITLMPKMAVREQEDGVRYLPLKASTERNVGLVFRASTSRRRTLIHLVQLLRAHQGLPTAGKAMRAAH
ncbi:LysR family transcriptional regulator [Permianibacter sp. IMCC34836]|uniref:LysR substrate-binding domain-containing protein n=1 Tax=Permianibacter fluminis TaxID=2738515 RepID=UPI001554F007|nr:LysR substrate-binding domain-containing protein [Permianibacter fluminis]NQD35410.1 LysR family transcriptional regulator [Permianibacter fluminis]